MFPLRTHLVHAAEYLRLDEAGGRVGFVGSEDSERSALEVVNAADQPVLIAAGEPLSGGARDLILTRAVLVRPGRVTSIPNRYVARGEPAAGSRDARVAPISVSSPTTRNRAKSIRAPTVAPVRTPIAEPDAASESRRGTETLGRAFDDLGIEPGQNGAIVAIGAEIVALEGFDAPETFAASFPRRLREYERIAREARAGSGAWSAPTQEDAEAFVARIAASPLEIDVTVGEGVGFLSSTGSVGGAVLAVADRVVWAEFSVFRSL